MSENKSEKDEIQKSDVAMKEDTIKNEELEETDVFALLHK